MFLRNPVAFWADVVIEHHTVLLCFTEVYTIILHIGPPSYWQARKLQVASFMETVGGNGIMGNRDGQSDPGKGK